MLNICKNFINNSLHSFQELTVLKENKIESKEKDKTLDKSDNDEYKNTVFYPSNKE
jgi:hypothetical protein